MPLGEKLCIQIFLFSFSFLPYLSHLKWNKWHTGCAILEMQASKILRQSHLPFKTLLKFQWLILLWTFRLGFKTLLKVIMIIGLNEIIHVQLKTFEHSHRCVPSVMEHSAVSSGDLEHRRRNGWYLHGLLQLLVSLKTDKTSNLNFMEIGDNREEFLAASTSRETAYHLLLFQFQTDLVLYSQFGCRASLG